MKKEGKTLSFIEQSTSYNEISSWHWDFGNGSETNEQNSKYTYDSSGTYTVTLKITDEDGDTSTYSEQVEIEGTSVTPAPSPPYTPLLSLPGLPWLSNIFEPGPIFNLTPLHYNLQFSPIGNLPNPFFINHPFLGLLFLANRIR